MKHFLLFVLCYLLIIPAFSQVRKKPAGFNKGKQQDKFLDKQFWIGFKAGTNLTQAIPGTRYSIIVPTNYPTCIYEQTSSGTLYMAPKSMSSKSRSVSMNLRRRHSELRMMSVLFLSGR